ncbi:17166_t:CDS:2 [Dentiscutata erythropus]|uniref:17166_t:CDS:1 n=1 Tax=Dentiscutata erythropus TaxID=1348616 RepID=A0A9N9H9A7_9GLOM|nr:17166_t:CDS:2 [Dentiscutata erythropus]
MDSPQYFPNCEWTVNVTSCVGEYYFQVVYGVTIYLSLFVFLSAIWLLLWRLCSKPNVKLFKLNCFFALEGFLFTQVLWSGASILRTIPRMHFYRQNPHYNPSLHLPTLRGIVSVYTSFIVLITAIVITCAIFTGYLRQDTTSDQQNTIKALIVIHFTTYSISCFLIVSGLVIYGKKLVNIANEGLRLLEGVNGYPTTPRSSKRYRFSLATRRGSSFSNHLELKHDQLKRALLKMRILHAAFTFNFIMLGLIIGIFAFYHQAIFENLIVSKMISILDNWMPMLLNVSVMAGIAYGEMRISDRNDPTLSNLTLTETQTQQCNTNIDNGEVFAQSEESIETTSVFTSANSHSRSSFHQRNESADSDTPLICNPSLSSINASDSNSLNGCRRGSSLRHPVSVKWPTIISPVHLSPKQSIQYGMRNSIKELTGDIKSLDRNSSVGSNSETDITSTYINIDLSPAQQISLSFPGLSEEIIGEGSTDGFVIKSTEVK